MSFLIIGIIGMFLILLAFILDEFYKKFNQDTIFYNLINLFGSGLLTYYAFILIAWPFVILNVVWFIVAGYKLVRILVNNRK